MNNYIIYFSWLTKTGVGWFHSITDWNYDNEYEKRRARLVSLIQITLKAFFAAEVCMAAGKSPEIKLPSWGEANLQQITQNQWGLLFQYQGLIKLLQKQPE